MSDRRARTIRRVLVALDASPGSLAAATSAARLAAVLEAELAGLFVEDPDLLRLGEAPQASQVGFLTAAAEPLGGGQMRRQLRAQAARARSVLSRVAEREGVACTFRVTRGRVTTELLAAAERQDVVSVGRIGWSRRQRRQLGSTARALLARRRSHTLLADRDMASAAPPAVLFDGSAAAADALRLAMRLARPTGGALRVLATSAQARAEAARQLGERAGPARIESLAPPLAPALAAAVGAGRTGLLLLPLGGPALEGIEPADLLAEIRCPVLAVS